MVTVSTYQTMSEAAGKLAEGSMYMAGGTIVMRRVNFGDQSFHNIIRVQQPERGITSDAQGIKIGAGTTMAEILAHRDLDFLHPVARQIGGPAIRNMATIGGNLFARNPNGDMAAALLALNAQVVMADGHASPIETFLLDRGHVRGLVASLIVPRVPHGAFKYVKISRVKPRGVAIMTISVLLGGSDPRVVFSNMGPTPLRAKPAERALAGGVNPSAIEAACAVCTQGLSPAEDALASAWYRTEVAPVHLRRLLTNGGLR
ncbi:xanthine dehydrogenase family protein subunit M [Falsihalocynthiibacter sp. S25ZX9]|uniref:FAD binding domain-containing protein n=1 Tax=Falsihalocynthiibacter sp. S25ZX9 TaxID=3240870 RepID=UPI00350FF733